MTESPRGRRKDTRGTSAYLRADDRPVEGEDKTLGMFFVEATTDNPDGVAIVSPDATWTYSQLRKEAFIVARGMIGHGVTKGTRVAIIAPNGPEFAALFFGLSLIGAVPVPISCFASGADIVRILQHSDAAAAFIYRGVGGRQLVSEFRSVVPDLGLRGGSGLALETLPQLRSVWVVPKRRSNERGSSWGSIEKAAQRVPEKVVKAALRDVQPTDDGVVLYTSGSTGKPKGVVHFQRGPVVIGYCWRDYLELTSQDRIFGTMPWFWSGGFGKHLCAGMAARSTLIVLDRFRPTKALGLLTKERATGIFVPAHHEVEIAETARAGKIDLSFVQRFRPDGSLKDVVPDGIPKKKVEGGYGLTEMCSFATGRPDKGPPDDPTDQGPPLPGVSIRIVRGDGTTAARAEQGQIAIGGPALFSHYQKGSAADRRDPDGLFFTGDLGHLDDAGHLHWEGRSDSMIRSRGVLISPVEIEEILMASGLVKIAKVVGVLDPLGETVPALFAVRHRSSLVTEAAIVTLLRSRLPDYKVPKSVTFIPEADLEWTQSQKVQIQALDALVKRAVVQPLDDE